MQADAENLVLDLNQIATVDLSHVEHLLCEWTGMELLDEAGMQGGTAAGRPGGQVALSLSLILDTAHFHEVCLVGKTCRL